MKNLLKYILPVALVASAFSCTKDNYAEPSLTLSGHVVYNGQALNLEKDQVPYLIYEYGFGKVGPIGSFSDPVANQSVTPTFAQDGSYSQVLFSGTYKIIIPNGQGPFMWKQTAAGNPDTVTVNLNGNQTLDLEVTPFWTIDNSNITAAGTNVNATFKATQIVTDANAKLIERVSLYINKTQFVAGGTNIAHTDLDGASITDVNNISLSVAIPTITPTQNYVFARVGIKLVGVEDMIFSPLVQVSF
jgi:hypothetical protein